MPDIQHRSSLVPLTVTKSQAGNVLRLPYDTHEFAALQNAVGQMVSIGAGTSAYTGLLTRFTPIDGKQMEVEVATTQ